MKPHPVPLGRWSQAQPSPPASPPVAGPVALPCELAPSLVAPLPPPLPPPVGSGPEVPGPPVDASLVPWPVSVSLVVPGSGSSPRSWSHLPATVMWPPTGPVLAKRRVVVPSIVSVTLASSCWTESAGRPV